jgi:hypothetical protein
MKDTKYNDGLDDFLNYVKVKKHSYEKSESHYESLKDGSRNDQMWFRSFHHGCCTGGKDAYADIISELKKRFWVEREESQ